MTREEAIKILKKYAPRIKPFYEPYRTEYPQAIDMAIKALQADTVEVVRCKDCKHKVITEDGEYDPEDIVCNYWMSDGLTEKDFCSYGERSKE